VKAAAIRTQYLQRESLININLSLAWRKRAATAYAAGLWRRLAAGAGGPLARRSAAGVRLQWLYWLTLDLASAGWPAGLHPLHCNLIYFCGYTAGSGWLVLAYSVSISAIHLAYLLWLASAGSAGVMAGSWLAISIRTMAASAMLNCWRNGESRLAYHQRTALWRCQLASGKARQLAGNQ